MKGLIILQTLLLHLVLSNTIHYHYYGEQAITKAQEHKSQHKASRRVKIKAPNGLYLSHAFSRIWFQHGYQGEGELWEMTDMDNGYQKLQAMGGERGKYLSHAFSRIWL